MRVKGLILVLDSSWRPKGMTQKNAKTCRKSFPSSATTPTWFQRTDLTPVRMQASVSLYYISALWHFNTSLHVLSLYSVCLCDSDMWEVFWSVCQHFLYLIFTNLTVTWMCKWFILFVVDSFVVQMWSDLTTHTVWFIQRRSALLWTCFYLKDKWWQSRRESHFTSYYFNHIAKIYSCWTHCFNRVNSDHTMSFCVFEKWCDS